MPKPTLVLRDLRDLHGFSASLIVDAPVPTATRTASTPVADDDDVFVTLLLPGGVKADVALTAAEYRTIAIAAANEVAIRASQALPLEG